ncbi:MAG: hypothetical protein IKK53_01820 [Ruminiclostridium sp.]|nr:hypothetical protein [Ruminiclostridium sp.]
MKKTDLLFMISEIYDEVYMSINVREMDYRNPELLKYGKPSHKAEIAVIIVGVLVMIFPFIVSMNHPAPIAGAEIIGVLCLPVGVVILVDSGKRHKRIMSVIETGRKYTAVITRINHMSACSRSGAKRWIHSYCAECEFTDPATNGKYLLTSRYVTYNLKGTEGREVVVCVNPDDMSNYYVDLTLENDR